MCFISLIIYVIIADILLHIIKAVYTCVLLNQHSDHGEKKERVSSRAVSVIAVIIGAMVFASERAPSWTSTLFDFLAPSILINTIDASNTAVVTIESEDFYFTPQIFYTVTKVSNGLEAKSDNEYNYQRYEDHFVVSEPCIVKAYCEVFGIRTKQVKESFSPQFTAENPPPAEETPTPDTPITNEPERTTNINNAGTGSHRNEGNTTSETLYAPPSPPPISEIGLSVPDSMTVGDELFATAIVYPVTTDQRSLFWETSDGNVLSVDDEGYICALSPGNVLLRVTSEVNPSVYTERQIYIESLFSSDDDDSVSDLSVDDIFFIDVGERRRIIGWDESIEASHIERIGCGVIADIDIIDGCIMGISEGTAIIEACVSTSCGNISYRWKVVVSDPEANFVTDE